jgi:hypothetical protein
LDKYSKALVVHADNVGSNQLMNIRKARGRAALPQRRGGCRQAAPGRAAARRARGNPKPRR